MGFPEAECVAALTAARGNADLAVDFLMNGIPASASRASASPAASSTPSATGIEQLRSHPQFNQLKGLVQSNPAALGQVLEAIGQQNPDLLRAIHANQAEFLAMMNEPITDTPAASGSGANDSNDMDIGGDYGDDDGDGEGGGMPNPLQMMAMLQALPPQMRAQAAASIGISPEQLQSITQMLSTLPPEQLQQLMSESAAAAGGGGGGGHGRGQNVIRLTAEEMQSVTRLTELGFDQQDAIAAFIACDKNEALAANLLLEGWTAGGGANDQMYN
jgi:UV excision repair protein RAD23